MRKMTYVVHHHADGDELQNDMREMGLDGWTLCSSIPNPFLNYAYAWITVWKKKLRKDEM